MWLALECAAWWVAGAVMGTAEIWTEVAMHFFFGYPRWLGSRRNIDGKQNMSSSAPQQQILQAVRELQAQIDAHDACLIMGESPDNSNLRGLIDANDAMVAALQLPDSEWLDARYSTTASGAIWTHPQQPI